ncbi:hypothetical protein E4U58_006129 [Claviceps cyperi]|nr:hypothetical protein E4U58_006129 [Claviceps cyperi]
MPATRRNRLPGGARKCAKSSNKGIGNRHQNSVNAATPEVMESAATGQLSQDRRREVDQVSIDPNLGSDEAMGLGTSHSPERIPDSDMEEGVDSDGDAPNISNSSPATVYMDKCSDDMSDENLPTETAAKFAAATSRDSARALLGGSDVLQDSTNQLFKLLILSTNSRDAASTLLTRMNKQVTLVLQGAFANDYPGISNFFKDLKKKTCPSLAKAMDPRAMEADEEEEDGKQGPKIKADDNDRNPSALHRREPSRDFIGITKSLKLGPSHPFFAKLKQAYERGYKMKSASIRLSSAGIRRSLLRSSGTPFMLPTSLPPRQRTTLAPM